MKLKTLAGLLLSLAFGSVDLSPQFLEDRIVGGKDTTIEEHPYQLSLRYEPKGHVCGASLLRSNIALIAAQCQYAFEDPSFKVRAGSTKRTSGGILVDVVDYCPHPKYDPLTFDYDVSVVLLNESLPLGPTIQTIALQDAGKEVSVNTVATLTGWGQLSEDEPLADILQEVQVSKVFADVCQNIYPDLVTDRMDCYGYEGGPCGGDSGSPLVVNGKQVGIVSWGHGCGDSIYPSVYTKIGNKEIHKHINKCIKNFSSR